MMHRYYSKQDVMALIARAQTGDVEAWFELSKMNTPLSCLGSTADSVSESTVITTREDAQALTVRLLDYAAKRRAFLEKHGADDELIQACHITDFFDLMLVQRKYAFERDGRWQVEDRAPEDGEAGRWCIDVYAIFHAGNGQHHTCVMLPLSAQTPVGLTHQKDAYTIEGEQGAPYVIRIWNMLSYIIDQELLPPVATEAEIETFFLDTLIENPRPIVLPDLGTFEFVLDAKKFYGTLNVNGDRVRIEVPRADRPVFIGIIEQFARQCARQDQSARRYITQQWSALCGAAGDGAAPNVETMPDRLRLREVSLKRNGSSQWTYGMGDDEDGRLTVEAINKRFKLTGLQCRSGVPEALSEHVRLFAAEQAGAFWNGIWQATDCTDVLPIADFVSALHLLAVKLDDKKRLLFTFETAGEIGCGIEIAYTARYGCKLVRQFVRIEAVSDKAVAPHCEISARLRQLETKARQQAAKDLLIFWNEDWRDVDFEDELTAEQFAAQLVLQDIVFEGQKKLALEYVISEPPISVNISCTPQRGFVYASLGE